MDKNRLLNLLAHWSPEARKMPTAATAAAASVDSLHPYRLIDKMHKSDIENMYRTYLQNRGKRHKDIMNLALVGGAIAGERLENRRLKKEYGEEVATSAEGRASRAGKAILTGLGAEALTHAGLTTPVYLKLLHKYYSSTKNPSFLGSVDDKSLQWLMKETSKADAKPLSGRVRKPTLLTGLILRQPMKNYEEERAANKKHTKTAMYTEALLDENAARRARLDTLLRKQ